MAEGPVRRAALCRIAAFSPATVAELDALVANFGLEQAAEVKAIEATTNHDVKALEYWIKDKTTAMPKWSRSANSFTSPVLPKTSTTCRMPDVPGRPRAGHAADARQGHRQAAPKWPTLMPMCR